jgi:DNA repair exonuclease SbcCD ATPase subunit
MTTNLDRLLYAMRADRDGKAQFARNAKRAHREARRHRGWAEKARAVLQQVAQTVQERAHRQIQAVVSRCLAAVFENPYRFVVKFEKKRGKTEAVPVFVRGGHEYAPTDGVGGGVLDVAAFGLRIAEVLMQRPAGRRLLILDEPFKFPSLRKGYRERVRDLLLALATDLDFQIVVITHDPTFEIGSVINLDDQ